MVINQNTDVERCVDIALNQFYGKGKLKDLYLEFNIKKQVVDLKERAINNNADKSKEVDVGSCDRWNLLYNMLKGSYTESESSYGNFECDKYEFIPNIEIKYDLTTDTEKFLIEHDCAFVNDIHTRLIPIQKNSKLTK